MNVVGAAAAAPRDLRLGRRLLPVLILCAAGYGALAGVVAAGRSPELALLLPLALLPVLLWRRPRAGVLMLFASTALVEQFIYTVGARGGAVTSRLPFFRTITPGSGVTPMEVLLALLVVIWAMQAVRARRRLIFPSRVGRALAALGLLLFVYFAVGLGRHGALKPALWELKPFIYVGILFVLSASLLTTKSSVRALLWVLVLASGAKAAYGLVIFVSIRHVTPRPDAVLAHEESFFFALFIVLTIGLWTFDLPGRLRTVATTLVPVVLMADMVNSRRTAWALLFAGGLLMVVISYVRFPRRRPVLRRCMAVVLLGAAVYLPLYWGKTGSTAQPARAIRSVVAPSSSDARDSSSDRYRLLEDANLALNIRAHHSAGSGFGVPIKYDIAITDLTGIASMLKYVPHDGVYWVWLRMGLVGEAVFWLVIAEAVIAACRLSAAADRETALLGAFVACALLSYVVMGQKDLGFYWFRIAVCMGVLVGVVEARTRQIRHEARGGEA